MYNTNDVSMAQVSISLGTKWTQLENKIFEEALVLYPEDVPDRWVKIAGTLPGKTPDDIEVHYDTLVRDINDIESGCIPVPDYADDGLVLSEEKAESIHSQNFGWSHRKRKGSCWTIDEHKLFLMGVDKFGWGDWRSISRNSVVSRTPAQVASHAQKFQLRQNALTKERKRSSIHDITTSYDSKTVTAPSNYRNQGS